MTKPTTVTVESLKYHTHDGKAHEIGDQYDVEEGAVENLVNQGMAAPATPAPPKKTAVPKAKAKGKNTAKASKKK